MSKWLIGAILVLAILVRLPHLDLYPIGFTPDEASFGYDAYSILHTGKDQWGHTLPLVLESFGDFKAPLYTYLDIPFVALLGLTKIAVRLPNALLGVGAVFVLYLLLRELLEKKEFVAVVGSFLLAISPWHIELSRGAFEANMITFFVPLGILLFLKGLKNNKYLPWSALVFGLSLFTYHTAKVLTPLVVGFLISLYRKELHLKFSRLLREKQKMAAIIIFSLFVFATGVTFLYGAGRRAADVSVFNGALESQAIDRLAAIQGGLSPMVSKIFYNQYIVASTRFWKNYSSYFSYSFLFESGPREGTYGMLPNLPVLYLFELPLLLSFFVFAFKNYRKKHVWVILFWLLISPIPTSLTQGVGHSANRAASMMPVLQICTAIGAYFLYELLTARNSLISRIVLLFYCFIVIIAFTNFVKNYVLFSPSVLAKPMLYQNLEVGTWLRDNARDTSKIVVSTSLSEPHIYVAFANNWDPKDYQLSTRDWGRYRVENRTFLDQLSDYKLGKYTFKHIEKEDLIGLSDTFLVGRPSEFPEGMEVIKRFMYPNGETSIVVVTPMKKTYAYKN